MKALALAFSMFSIAPVPSEPEAGSGRSRHALRYLPFVGGTVGFVAAMGALVVWRGYGLGSPLLGAVIAVVLCAAMTRGLHVDGLADVTDGLGSGRPAPEALEIMRRSDIGPFGVLAIVAVALIQIASLASIFDVTTRWQGVVTVVVAAASGRLAAVVAARRGVPSARPNGFGALVAGSVEPLALTALTAATVGVSIGLAAASGFEAAALGWFALVLVAAQVIAWGASVHIVRRLGGVTGDIFGALIEIATTATLLGLAIVVVWRGHL